MAKKETDIKNRLSELDFLKNNIFPDGVPTKQDLIEEVIETKGRISVRTALQLNIMERGINLFPVQLNTEFGKELKEFSGLKLKSPSTESMKGTYSVLINRLQNEFKTDLGKLPFSKFAEEEFLRSYMSGTSYKAIEPVYQTMVIAHDNIQQLTRFSIIENIDEGKTSVYGFASPRGGKENSIQKFAENANLDGAYQAGRGPDQIVKKTATGEVIRGKLSPANVESVTVPFTKALNTKTFANNSDAKVAAILDITVPLRLKNELVDIVIYNPDEWLSKGGLSAFQKSISEAGYPPPYIDITNPNILQQFQAERGPTKIFNPRNLHPIIGEFLRAQAETKNNTGRLFGDLNPVNFSSTVTKESAGLKEGLGQMQRSAEQPELVRHLQGGSDFRKLSVTILLDSGFSIDEIEQVLSHKGEQTTASKAYAGQMLDTADNIHLRAQETILNKLASAFNLGVKDEAEKITSLNQLMGGKGFKFDGKLGLSNLNKEGATLYPVSQGKAIAAETLGTLNIPNVPQAPREITETDAKLYDAQQKNLLAKANLEGVKVKTKTIKAQIQQGEATRELASRIQKDIKAEEKIISAQAQAAVEAPLQKEEAAVKALSEATPEELDAIDRASGVNKVDQIFAELGGRDPIDLSDSEAIKKFKEESEAKTPEEVKASNAETAKKHKEATRLSNTLKALQKGTGKAAIGTGVALGAKALMTAMPHPLKAAELALDTTEMLIAPSPAGSDPDSGDPLTQIQEALKGRSVEELETPGSTEKLIDEMQEGTGERERRNTLLERMQKNIGDPRSKLFKSEEMQPFPASRREDIPEGVTTEFLEKAKTALPKRQKNIPKTFSEEYQGFIPQTN